MIRYALVCAKGHDFESWFPNSSAYDKQVKRGLVTCPSCGSAKVEKAIMAPRLTSGTRHDDAEPASAADNLPVPAETPAPVAMMTPQEAEFRRKL